MSEGVCRSSGSGTVPRLLSSRKWSKKLPAFKYVRNEKTPEITEGEQGDLGVWCTRTIQA
jgi:hypothetical protein